MYATKRTPGWDTWHFEPNTHIFQFLALSTSIFQLASRYHISAGAISLTYHSTTSHDDADKRWKVWKKNAVGCRLPLWKENNANTPTADSNTTSQGGALSNATDTLLSRKYSKIFPTTPEGITVQRTTPLPVPRRSTGRPSKSSTHPKRKTRRMRRIQVIFHV